MGHYFREWSTIISRIFFQSTDTPLESVDGSAFLIFLKIVPRMILIDKMKVFETATELRSKNTTNGCNSTGVRPGGTTCLSLCRPLEGHYFRTPAWLITIGI